MAKSRDEINKSKRDAYRDQREDRYHTLKKEQIHLDQLGTFTELGHDMRITHPVKFLERRIRLLKNYVEALDQRVKWGELYPGPLRTHCRRLIEHEEPYLEGMT